MCVSLCSRKYRPALVVVLEVMIRSFCYYG